MVRTELADAVVAAVLPDIAATVGSHRHVGRHDELAGTGTLAAELRNERAVGRKGHHARVVRVGDVQPIVRADPQADGLAGRPLRHTPRPKKPAGGVVALDAGSLVNDVELAGVIGDDRAGVAELLGPHTGLAKDSQQAGHVV